jgi:hypothetical protein
MNCKKAKEKRRNEIFMRKLDEIDDDDFIYINMKELSEEIEEEIELEECGVITINRRE